MTGLKFLLLGTLAGVATSVVGDTAAQIAAIAAGVAGAGYMWKRVVLPFGQLIHRALTAYQVLEHLAPWMHDVDERLDRLEAKTDAIHEPAEAVARELGVEHRRPAA